MHTRHWTNNKYVVLKLKYLYPRYLSFSTTYWFLVQCPVCILETFWSTVLRCIPDTSLWDTTEWRNQLSIAGTKLKMHHSLLSLIPCFVPLCPRSHTSIKCLHLSFCFSSGFWGIEAKILLIMRISISMSSLLIPDDLKFLTCKDPNHWRILFTGVEKSLHSNYISFFCQPGTEATHLI